MSDIQRRKLNSVSTKKKLRPNMLSFCKHFALAIFVKSEKKIRKLLKMSNRLIPGSCIIIKLHF